METKNPKTDLQVGDLIWLVNLQPTDCRIIGFEGDEVIVEPTTSLRISLKDADSHGHIGVIKDNITTREKVPCSENKE